MQHVVRERPILFSEPMVRALLDGRKTQTRRIVKDGKPFADWNVKPSDTYDAIVSDDQGSAAFLAAGDHGFTDWVPCPYGKPGDRLWVRETWQYGNGLAQRAAGDGLVASGDAAPRVLYRADGHTLPAGTVWRPSIFIRRTESRILLEVTGVHVERLQAITDADAHAEGVMLVGRRGTDTDPGYVDTYRYAFQRLWDSINGKRAPWSSNPWLWCVSFRRVE
jgi:hypothetical protein